MLHYFSVLLLFFSLLSYSYAGAPEFDQAKLDQIAEIDGYGYKYANLKMLTELNIWFNKKELPYRIAIPEFIGISSARVQDFLKKYGVDSADRWSKLLTLHLKEKEASILSTKQYPQAFLIAQRKFEQQLLEDFTGIINSIANTVSLDTLFDVIGIDVLLKDVASRGERFMVRSSGKEDTKKLANAGGNESKANVTPAPKDILYALRDVLVSYFGQKSLKQRLGAGDQSIFDPRPFTPVLIQRMVGEKESAELPKCGVMFTEEAEGGVARYAMRDMNNNVIGKLKTTGITIIQSAYGHNEGVVNSIIPVDTYYIDNHDTIYSIIRPKTHRMMPDPDKTGALKLVKNMESVVHDPALSKDAVLTLKAYAKVIEEYYKEAMDVEFVVNESEKIIYIVQARPIVHKKDLSPASYITYPESFLPENKVNGEPIGVAGGSLRLITKRSQIIVEKNISNALAVYQDQEQTPDTKIVEAIIVGKMAPATSHEATAFRSEGKPVIFIEQWPIVKNWLKKDAALLVSPQQGIVAKLADDTNSLADMLQNNTAKKGWVNYPVPLLLSMSPKFAEWPKKNWDEIVLSLLPEGQSIESFAKKLFSIADFKNLIEALKNGDKVQAEAALTEIIFAIRSIVKQAHGSKKGMLDSSYQRRVSLLFAYATTIAQRLKSILDVETNTQEEYSARLFYIRMLESILFQRPGLGTIEDGMFSLERIVKGLSEERAIRETQAISEPMAIKLMRISSLAKTDNLKKSWEDFIKNFMAIADASDKEEMIRIILDIGTFDALSLWLHTSFAAADRIARHDAKIIAEQIILEFKADGNFLSQINQKLKLIKGFNVGIFDNPKNFSTGWQILYDEMLAYFLSTDFKNSFVSAGNLGRLISIRLLAKLVNEVVDLSTKAVTGSQLYSDEQKISSLKILLPQFEKLMHAIISLQRILPKQKQLDTYQVGFISSVLSRNQFSPADLRATPGFKVSLVTIGNGVSTENLVRMKDAEPRTLEDAFTLIHQNILVVLGALTASVGIEDVERPIVLKKVESALQKISSTHNTKPFLISADISNSAISLVYNLPLQTHSGQFELIYNDKSNTVTIKAKFFGDARYRWWTMAEFINFFRFPGLITFSDIDTSSNQISFDLVVSPTVPEDVIQKIFDMCSMITFSTSYNWLDVETYAQILQLFKDASEKEMVYKISLENAKENLHHDQQSINILEALLIKPTFDWITQDILAIARQTNSTDLKLRLLRRLVLEGEQIAEFDNVGFQEIGWKSNGRDLGVALIKAQIKANNIQVINQALTLIDKDIQDNRCKEQSSCMQLLDVLLQAKNQTAAKKYFELFLRRINDKILSFSDQMLIEKMLTISDEIRITQVLNIVSLLLKSENEKKREIGYLVADILISLDMKIDALTVLFFELCEHVETADVGLKLLSQLTFKFKNDVAKQDFSLKALKIAAKLITSDVQETANKAHILINQIIRNWPLENNAVLFEIPYQMMKSNRKQDKKAAAQIFQRLIKKYPLIPEDKFDATLDFAITSLQLEGEEDLIFSRDLLVKLLNLDYLAIGKIKTFYEKFFNEAERSLDDLKTDADIKKHVVLIALCLMMAPNIQLKDNAVSLIEKYSLKYKAHVDFVLRSFLKSDDFTDNLTKKHIGILKKLIGETKTD